MNYNLKAILERMEEFKNTSMSLHGGEPLALPKKDVAKLFEKMFEINKKSSIQTNGTLIDNDFIKMFKKYKTSVGVSYDGPGELSDFRPGTKHLDKTIKKLVKNGISTSIIMVITKANAGTDKRLRKLKDYLLELDKIRIAGRVNPCVDASDCELSEKRLIEVYLDLAQFCLENSLRWSPFTDIIHGLQGKSRVCTFMGCDPFSTRSAIVLVNDGSLSNCMRTNEKYILLRHPVVHNTREEILQETPQKFGGCQKCKYWTACRGGCPSAVINNDWRNRTYLCSLWKALFQYFENILRFTEHPSILCQAQKATRPSSGEKKTRSGQEHIDHQDISRSKGHKDTGHNDWPNHGDHKDVSREFEEIKPEEKHKDAPHNDWPNHSDN